MVMGALFRHPVPSLATARAGIFSAGIFRMEECNPTFVLHGIRFVFVPSLSAAETT
jgi:hypothetical protein